MNDMRREKTREYRIEAMIMQQGRLGYDERKKHLGHNAEDTDKNEEVRKTIRLYLILAAIYLVMSAGFIIESIKYTNSYKLWIGIVLLILTVYKVISAIIEAKKRR